MNTAEQILVVFLSSALALSLLLSIILLVICIKIANHIRRISEKAEAITDRAENIADFFGKAATPMAIGHAIKNVADMVFSKKSSKKRRDG